MVISPVAALPPGTPLTLQVTVASEAFVTVAEKAWVLPRRTEAVFGDIVMLTTAGGVGVGIGFGGGGAEAEVVTLPQPWVRAIATRIGTNDVARIGREEIFAGSMERVSGRGRMRRRNAGEGPAKNGRKIVGRQILERR